MTLPTPQHGALAPSPWVQRWSTLVAPGASVLDVACGTGRHARWFAARGARVTALDRDAQAMAAMLALPGAAIELIVADIEDGPWPLPGRHFDVVVVTNYLWRPLMPALVASIDVGGLLIYETFAQGNETVGKPSNPDYLLHPGELLQLAADLRVIAFEDGFIAEAPARFVQRIAAVRQAERSAAPARYPL